MATANLIRVLPSVYFPSFDLKVFTKGPSKGYDGVTINLTNLARLENGSTISVGDNERSRGLKVFNNVSVRSPGKPNTVELTLELLEGFQFVTKLDGTPATNDAKQSATRIVIKFEQEGWKIVGRPSFEFVYTEVVKAPPLTEKRKAAPTPPPAASAITREVHSLAELPGLVREASGALT